MIAAGAGAREPLDRLQRVGRAYVDFALGHAGFFRVMFGREVSELAAPPAPLVASGERAFGVLTGAVEAVLARWPAASRPSVEAVAFACWSAVHGAATLWIDGPLRRRTPSGAERAQLERGLSATFQLLGAALAPPRAAGRRPGGAR
jgi:hypothetical protein